MNSHGVGAVHVNISYLFVHCHLSGYLGISVVHSRQDSPAHTGGDINPFYRWGIGSEVDSPGHNSVLSGSRTPVFGAGAAEPY